MCSKPDWRVVSPLPARVWKTLQLHDERGVFLCNPPYGERLGDRKSCEKLYGEMRLLKERHPGWSLCAI
jgi:putative N6-adenine-specific DNA methylase